MRSFDFDYTCPQINGTIDEMEKDAEQTVSLSDAVDAVNTVRTLNEQMRAAAEDQIEELEYRNNELENQVEELLIEVSNLTSRLKECDQ